MNTPKHKNVASILSDLSTIGAVIVPPAYASGKLTPEGKEWLRANGACFYCRLPGHVIESCAKFVKYKADNPGKVYCYRIQSAKPSLVKPREGEVVGDSSNKIRQNSLSSKSAPAYPLVVRFSKDFQTREFSSKLPVSPQAKPPVRTSKEKKKKPSKSPVLPQAKPPVRTSKKKKPSKFPVLPQAKPPVRTSKKKEHFKSPVLTQAKPPGRMTTYVPETDPTLEFGFIEQLPNPPSSNITPSDPDVLLEWIGEELAPVHSVQELKSDEMEEEWPVWTAPGNRMLFQAHVFQAAKPSSTTVPFSISANCLVDSGCDGMVLSERFAKENNIPILRSAPKNVSMADNSIVSFGMECRVRVRIGRFTKELTFAVGPIAEDMIFGIPFFSSIIVFNADWKNHRFFFRSRAGTIHKWYGVQHKLSMRSPKVNMAPMFSLLGKRTEAYACVLITVKSTRQQSKTEPLFLLMPRCARGCAMLEYCRLLMSSTHSTWSNCTRTMHTRQPSKHVTACSNTL